MKFIYSSGVNSHLSLSGLRCESVMVHLPGFPVMDLIIFILLGDTKRRPERFKIWGGSDCGEEVVSYTRSSKSVILSHCRVRHHKCG